MTQQLPPASGTDDGPIWSPSRERVESSRLFEFLEFAAENGAPSGIGAGESALDAYQRLRHWSVRDPAAFWSLVWQRFGVVASTLDDGSQWETVAEGIDRMVPPVEEGGPKWFRGARLNFAENLLKRQDDAPALISWDERGRRDALTFAELSLRVEDFARALSAAGIVAGDRVAGFMPNIPETIIAMLAAARIGAVWSSCSPDFGVQGVLDRFGQIEPRVLVCADGYRYGGREHDCLTRVREIAAAITSVEHVVVVPLLFERPELQLSDARGPSAHLTPQDIRGGKWWHEFVHAALREEVPPFQRLPFSHPLYIMYSSGTTGLPKCMVHSAGGTLLQHLKEHALHTDIGDSDRVFYFTTCGWMMWNWLASSLALGATVVLYDGAPLPRGNPAVLWDMVQQERVTVFGTSAKYVALAEKQGVRPAATHDLSSMRTILSTGSPLAEHSYDYVYRDVHQDVCLASISGGTDLISCFALGNPLAPVWRGELQTIGLGMAVEVFDDNAMPVIGEPGELVCTRPFPSMPVCFWNDPRGQAYRDAYFEQIPGVWRHGDWAEVTTRGGLVIYGRSDATLNPGGVRIGTAEIYREVEQLNEVVESLVVGQDVEADGSRDVRVVLFVKLADGVQLDNVLRERIRKQVRAHASPHHVPKVILQVSDIPRTISGKITELAVREVIHGRPVRNRDALANPEALEYFRNRPELQA
ncbi:MAG TPA: acetoacetate--CoA ligase [Gemmatimonadales bacterium]|nr:acetoacetate--CoA ligase [Gemmatimonadales bacterium]